MNRTISGQTYWRFWRPAIGSAFVAATIYLCFGFAARLAVVMDPTGMNVIVKLSSFLLVRIGVQIVWNGELLASALPAAVPAISH
jgi:multiple antibiotic resistance protein